MSIVTLDEARAALGHRPDEIQDDDEIQTYVDAITPVVEKYTKEILEPRTVTQDVQLWGDQEFYLKPPVTSLTSLVSFDGVTTWDVSKLKARPTGQVLVLSGPAPSGWFTATYQGGYVTVPANYKRGALVILQHLWETQRGTGSALRGVVGPEETYDPTGMYSVPRKALEWFGKEGSRFA